MVLGIMSYGQLAVLLGGAAIFLGPKDLQRVAKTAGRLAGKAVGYMKAVRGDMDTVVQRGHMTEMHKDLQATMAQLEAIRYEIRSGISIFGSGAPRTRENVDVAAPPAPPAPASASAPVVRKVEPEECFWKGVEFVNMETRNSLAAKQEEDAGKEIVVIPVSAVAAKRIVPKTGATVGSDMILEAVEEMKVASEALAFIQQADAEASS